MTKPNSVADSDDADVRLDRLIRTLLAERTKEWLKARALFAKSDGELALENWILKQRLKFIKKAMRDFESVSPKPTYESVADDCLRTHPTFRHARTRAAKIKALVALKEKA